MSSLKQAYLDAIGAQIIDPAQPEVKFSSAADTTPDTTNTTILTPLEHLGLIRATGEDAAGFLHNLMSNDIKKLAQNSVQHNSFNSPKGRMLASFLVSHDEQGYLLQLSADLLAAIHKKLSMYVLRAKVKLALPGDTLSLIGIAGPAIEKCLANAGLSLPTADMTLTPGEIQVVRLAADRAEILVPTEQAAGLWQQLLAAGAQAAGTDAWRLQDIQAGIPLITASTQDEFVAQMVNFELLGGVNFQKGCYPGQEIVARTQYLGKLKKRMFFAHLDAAVVPSAGTDVFAPEFGEQSCGKVLSAATSPSGGFDLLVVTQLSAHDAGDVRLGSPDGTRLAFGTLPYVVE